MTPCFLFFVDNFMLYFRYLKLTTVSYFPPSGVVGTNFLTQINFIWSDICILSKYEDSMGLIDKLLKSRVNLRIMWPTWWLVWLIGSNQSWNGLHNSQFNPGVKSLMNKDLCLLFLSLEYLKQGYFNLNHFLYIERCMRVLTFLERFRGRLINI